MASTSTKSPNARRTRIVCISDTHNSTVKLPKGDVLIHAGDLTNQGSYSELFRTIQWLEKADFEAKIVIAGNHDITLDAGFYEQHQDGFHNQKSEDAAKCLSLLTSSPTITYLCHSSATVRLTDPKGPGTEFTVFGSPYSPRVGLWAFSYDREETLDPSKPNPVTSSGPRTTDLWAAIPHNTDILVTHTPPHGHCDNSLGCHELQRMLSEIRPRLHVCGHVHHGRGAKRIRWGAKETEDGYVEAGVETWEDPYPDPKSLKISLVDLTARGGKRALDFQDPTLREDKSHHADRAGSPDLMPRISSRSAPQTAVDQGTPQLPERAEPNTRLGPSRTPVLSQLAAEETATLGHRPQGQGRRETCVVNCAIAATSWPHSGGKRFHKPIVVDLDLPVAGT
ncbi:Metallo-dependent phosphatase-like protein [Podospora australis]|uniref:Metallo-dependent phosphatase-like protein n=1 Tax=Podospora australis TaxID=1536484 RepID=A0AAN6WX27_9PEZI|nr:Metallo-dependent phosphatase-like protein [Podospora australis]